MKRCSKCKTEQPETEFGPNPKARDGLDYRCRTCGRARRQAQRERLGDKWEKLDPYKEHPTGQKNCKRCGHRKFVQEFARDRTAPDGLQRYCRGCQVEQWQLAEYGCIVPKDARCALCGRAGGPKNKLGVDHRHKDGKVRGVLCRACNTGLGQFEDDPALLRRAAEYVEQNPKGRL